MLGTTRPAVRFCCPGCGASLRAPRADSGTAIACPRCAEQIRVPRNPHPRESEPDDGPLIDPVAAASARSGIFCLQASLALWIAWALLTITALAVWVAEEGPAAVLNREAADLRRPLVATAMVTLMLAWTAAGLRWVGYARCLPAGVAMRAGGWVNAARFGVLVGIAGQTVADFPWLLGMPYQRTPAVVRAVCQVGDLARVAGAVLECGVLFMWARLLTEAGGTAAAVRIGRYVLTAVAGIAATVTGLCAAGMLVVMAVAREGPPPPAGRPGGRVNPAAVPDEGWYALAAVVAVAVGFAAVLSAQYARILSASRAAVAPPISR